MGGCFPGPNNTGVPAGTSLTVIGSSGQGWTFSPGQRLLEIKSCGVVLNAVKVPGDVYLNSSASNGTHSASTPCVTITNSEIDGFVDVQDTDGSQAGGPLVLTDDTVDTPNTDDDRSPVLSENYYATGLNVEGARLGYSCRGFCTITDSYAHDGFLEQEFHYNAVGSNGLEGPLVIEHDSLACDFSNTDQTAINNGAGCSDDIGLFGDFDPISNVTVDKSLFVSSSAAFAASRTASTPTTRTPGRRSRTPPTKSSPTTFSSAVSGRQTTARIDAVNTAPSTLGPTVTATSGAVTPGTTASR